MKHNLTWVLMHASLMAIVLINLLTGMRIATLDRPYLLWFSAILPQGGVHGVHLWTGFSLLGLAVIYAAYQWVFRKEPTHRRYNSPINIYHSVVKWVGYLALSGLLLTGLSLYLNTWPVAFIKDVHFACAITLLVYIPLHAGVYFVQYGIGALKIISTISAKDLRENTLLMVFGCFILAAIYATAIKQDHESLHMIKIAPDTLIDIDGNANEPDWQHAKDVVVHGFGGANFQDGRTDISIKALHNNTEAFFYIRWEDSTKSMAYLPLVKTPNGWQVQQQGFHHFDEKKYYEDKFAMMVSNNCDFAASGTAHMGPKPLADKPANWHGKGYHYTEDNSVVDLWQWKAVRTNDMYLADDNFIGAPDIERPGSRRYTGGYQQDGKDSGAYVMNWKWYKKEFITPKRLPKDPAELAPYQPNAYPDKNTELSWVIPWFAYEPYSEEKDKLIPVGTLMPSVMYNSNQFEGDRADVRARGQWQDGYWSLELVRKLTTGSEKDVALQNGVCLWVAAFDHAQIAHTRHARPLKLLMEK